MNKLPKVKVWFTIEGIFNVKDLYQKMDIECAKLRDINDWPDSIINNKNLPVELQPRCEWSLEIIEEDCDDIKEPLLKLIDLLRNKVDIIQNMKSNEILRQGFTIVVYESKKMPEISLTRDIIHFLELINSEICFDIER